MYGLVNKGIEELICQDFGEETWELIKQKSGAGVDTFISMENYDDKVIYSLVAAASEVLQIPADDILEKFGEYWVLYTAQKGYREMFEMSENLTDFLQQLDMMHMRLGTLMPNLSPPSFECTDISSNSLMLHYYTKREGLAPMVIGLIKGLGKFFQCNVQIEQKKFRRDWDHDVFYIWW